MSRMGVRIVGMKRLSAVFLVVGQEHPYVPGFLAYPVVLPGEDGSGGRIAVRGRSRSRLRRRSAAEH